MGTIDRRAIHLNWRNQQRKVWVVGDFEGYLDNFAIEVGGRLDDERCPFGVLLWPSSRTLAEVLADQPSHPPPRRIIELGCGVGYLSCVLATIYPEAEVIACDYETSLGAFVAMNAEEWGVADRVRFLPIDWRKAPPPGLGLADLVIGADVFYDDSHLIHLPPFAAQIMTPDARLVLADPRRFRFSKALDDLTAHFTLESHEEVRCALDQEGIDEFMIGAGYKEQKISILTLLPRPALAKG